MNRTFVRVRQVVVTQMKYIQWRLLDIFVVLGFYFILMILFYGIIALIFGTDVINNQNSPPWFSLVGGLVECGISVFLPVLVVTRRYRADVKDIGLELVGARALGAGLLVGVAIWALGSLMNYGMENVFGPAPVHPDLARLRAKSSDVIEYLMLLFPLLVLTPVGEEVYMRSFVYTVLRKRYGVATAALASSLLFSSLHLSLWYFFSNLRIGIGIGLVT